MSIISKTQRPGGHRASDWRLGRFPCTRESSPCHAWGKINLMCCHLRQCWTKISMHSVGTAEESASHLSLSCMETTIESKLWWLRDNHSFNNVAWTATFFIERRQWKVSQSWGKPHASGKRPVRLWASLASFQRRKDAKDAKMSRLWKVGYLVSERHHASFKDVEHLSKPCQVFLKNVFVL